MLAQLKGRAEDAAGEAAAAARAEAANEMAAKAEALLKKAAEAALERETALRNELDAAAAREAAANKRADELKARLTEDRATLGPELVNFAIQLRSAGEKAAAKKAEEAAAIAAQLAEMRVRDELMVETEEAESDVLRAANDGGPGLARRSKSKPGSAAEATAAAVAGTSSERRGSSAALASAAARAASAAAPAASTSERAAFIRAELGLPAGGGGGVAAAGGAHIPSSSPAAPSSALGPTISSPQREAMEAKYEAQAQGAAAQMKAAQAQATAEVAAALFASERLRAILGGFRRWHNRWVGAADAARRAALALSHVQEKRAFNTLVAKTRRRASRVEGLLRRGAAAMAQRASVRRSTAGSTPWRRARMPWR